jgi:hypothetical protein
MNTLVSLEEAARHIRQGRPLAVAGSEALLKQLPKGQWIGGTIPYFMGPEGGVLTHDRVFISELPKLAREGVTRSYDEAHLPDIARDGADGGCTFVIVPGFSDVHATFGRDAQTWDGVFDRPLVGWVSGLDLKDAGKVKPGVIDGATGEYFTDRAVALHVKLEPGALAKVDIINIFSQGTGDEIAFPDGGFKVRDALINGKRQNFASYLVEKGIDTKLPLVADYSGAMVNVSFQTVDAKSGDVALYAPVFPEMTYKVAAPVGDYAKAFQAKLDAAKVAPAFTCNCILNYLYGELEGRHTGDLQGAITFGEIAFLLLNQTLVHVSFEKP